MYRVNEYAFMNRVLNKPVVIYTTNGFQIKGTITNFDDAVLLVRNEAGKNQMVYKNAISTIEAKE